VTGISSDSWELPSEYEHIYSGKVRDLYRMSTGDLLVVASDRISAYDYILETLIPDKGKILTQLSLWWFEQLADILPNHVKSSQVPEGVAGRALICEALEMYSVECVVRGYLTGSGLSDYTATGRVCGVELPDGLSDGSRLPEPIFSPATKAAIGDHDENVDFDYVAAMLGRDRAEELRRLSLDIYARAEQIARSQGIILADTKFEFGASQDGADFVLGDEVLTPDSSRFWPVDEWEPGRSQSSYDKQYVRDWLTSAESGWSRTSGESPPALPEYVVEATRARYIEAFERLTNQRWT
jgi:phosphoribosylaminoimidazole-succinocarboxamide synthase